MHKFKWSPLLDGDGDIGAASAAASESQSVDAGAAEGAPAAGIAPAADPTLAEPAVSDQASFAARLREERAKIDAQYADHKAAAAQIEQLAKAAGFKSGSEYLTALDAHVRQQKAEAEAQRLGVDQAAYKEYFEPVQSELAQTKQQLQQLRQAESLRQVQADYDRLKAAYPDFATLEDQVFDLAQKRGLRLEDAYKLAAFDSRIAAVKQETEQQVLANITGRDNKQVLPGSDKGSSVTLDPEKMSFKDIEEISQRVQRGERITF
jgi:hypothetical protein